MDERVLVGIKLRDAVMRGDIAEHGFGNLGALLPQSSVMRVRIKHYT